MCDAEYTLDVPAEHDGTDGTEEIDEPDYLKINILKLNDDYRNDQIEEEKRYRTAVSPFTTSLC